MEAVLDPLVLLSVRTTTPSRRLAMMTEQSTRPKVSFGKDSDPSSNIILKVLPNGTFIPSWTTTATMQQVLKQIVKQ